jgi:SecD/SecF fusion protein
MPLPFELTPTNITLIAAAIVGFSFVVGVYLAKLLRMKDYGWKFAVILMAFLSSGAVLTLGWPPQKGIDLGGGMLLVYQVDPDKLVDDATLQKMIARIRERVNPSGQKEATVQKLGSDKIQITLPQPGPGRREQIKSIIQQTGALVFRIVATEKENEAQLRLARTLPGNEQEVVSQQGVVVARWTPVAPKAVGQFIRDLGTTRWVAKNGQVIDPRSVQGDLEQELKGAGATLQLLVLVPPPKPGDLTRTPDDVSGDYLKHAAPGQGENGMPIVRFNFSGEGAIKSGRLTGENVGRNMAIVLDDAVQSAPTIQSKISDSGQISGNFTITEVEELSTVLNAGSLPASLIKTPVRDLNTGATLGADTVRKSTNAMLLAAILVPLFMLWYYRFSGLVANVALALNMLILVALMILVGAPFTLPALAGLALTVGIAVDNNVLIYERLREELHRGAALRMAIRNSFHRAGAVIIDANITNMIAGLVLFRAGTDQVKGFAFTFFVGALISIWTTMFVARVIFEVAERTGWLKKAKMMQVIGETRIDFMHWFRVAATVSVLITVLGVGVAIYRGAGLFDIDFTGGVSVQAQFREAQKIDDVRRIVESAPEDLPDAAVSDVHLVSEDEGRRFIINTSNPSLEAVEKELVSLFGDKLEKNQLANAKDLKLDRIPAEPTAAEATAAGKVNSEKTSAEKTKTEAKPPAATSTESATDKNPEKVPEKPAEKTGEPDAKQSRNDLPPNTMLALADSSLPLLAQADKTAKTDAIEAAKTPEAKEKPADKAAPKEQAKPEEKIKPEEKAKTAAEEKPADKAAPKEQAKPEEKIKPEEKATTAPAKTTQPGQSTMGGPRAVDPQAGGTQVELKFDHSVDQKAVVEYVQQALKEIGIAVQDPAFFAVVHPQKAKGEIASDTEWTLKIKLPPERTRDVVATVGRLVKERPYFPDVDKIGTAVAKDTQFYAIIALSASWALMILYLWVRFQAVAFGVAAVVALIHDVLVMLGAIAVSYYIAPLFGWLMIDPFKINLTIVAAFLTIIGFSVNDTIVIFDRIREIRGKDPRITPEMVNTAVNQTLSRTLLTSFTVFLVVVILYLFGGQPIHGFAFALIVGVATGTYSSVFVAAPLLLWLVHPKEMRRVPRPSEPGLQKSK